MRSALIASLAVGFATTHAGTAAAGELLDPGDRAAIEETAQESLEYARTGEPGVWVNPVTGNQGIFTPVATYTGPRGRVCREYTLWGNLFGDEQEARGAACREPDGHWVEAGFRSPAPPLAVTPPYRAVTPPLAYRSYAPYTPYTVYTPYTLQFRFSTPGYYAYGYGARRHRRSRLHFHGSGRFPYRW